MAEGQGKSILLVDDETDILDSLAGFLKRRSFEVYTAATGKEGLRIAKEKKPDLIVLDLILPDIDGSDVASELLQDPKTRNIPIIFLTCMVTKPEQDETGVYIANRCIVAKPCKPEEILALIKERLGNTTP